MAVHEAGTFDCSKQFAELCHREDGVTEAISMETWLGWPWLQQQLGPPGSRALLTEEAARTIWRRLIPEGNQATPGDFVKLYEEVCISCKRATAIQAVLRGRKGRRSAEQTIEKVQGENSEHKATVEARLAPFNPTPSCAVTQALDALTVGPNDVLYDLGCGDGRVLLAAAARGARAIGVEYDVQLVEKARKHVDEAGVADLVSIVHGDACIVDLTPATKIFVYLVPAGLERIGPSLVAAQRRRVAVASYTFTIPSLGQPAQALTAESRAPECRVWLYSPNPTPEAKDVLGVPASGAQEAAPAAVHAVDQKKYQD